jgi:hypothetical protein
MTSVRCFCCPEAAHEDDHGRGESGRYARQRLLVRAGGGHHPTASGSLSGELLCELGEKGGLPADPGRGDACLPACTDAAVRLTSGGTPASASARGDLPSTPTHVRLFGISRPNRRRIRIAALDPKRTFGPIRSCDGRIIRRWLWSDHSNRPSVSRKNRSIRSAVLQVSESPLVVMDRHDLNAGRGRPLRLEAAPSSQAS